MVAHPPRAAGQKHKRDKNTHKDIAHRQPQHAHPEQPRYPAKAYNALVEINVAP